MANSSGKANSDTNWSVGKEKEEQQKSQSKFNNVTKKENPENQNQTHNVKQEGTSQINQNR
ncbi:MAG: hypothetical protein ACERKZ_10445 [Lachnotalea sp.]